MYGHFDAFRNRLKREEARKAQKRQALYDKKESYLDNSRLKKIKEFDFPEISDEELKIFKEKIQRKAHKKRKKERLIWFILILITLAFIVTNFVTSNSTQKQEIQTTVTAEDIFLNKNLNEYVYLIDEGDKWIEKRNWNNAIYRYQQAIDLFPENFESNYRLALAYSYSCKFQNKNCSEGDKLTSRLLKYFPEKEILKQLKSNFKK